MDKFRTTVPDIAKQLIPSSLIRKMEGKKDEDTTEELENYTLVFSIGKITMCVNLGSRNILWELGMEERWKSLTAT
jgi:hypothetical protein